MKHPKSIFDEIAVIDGEIEPGVAKLVEAMRGFGFDTVSSCEGHFSKDSFRHVRPNVVFRALDRGLLHAWVKEVSVSVGEDVFAFVEFYMFPVWDADRNVVHEDNWTVWIDCSKCETCERALIERQILLEGLVAALERAAQGRPLAVDTFVRSRW